jgi:plasmid replication initiation protein
VYNAGKNFTVTEFKQLTSFMSIKVKEVPIKAYNNIGLIKRYHTLLCRVYKILKAELKNKHINKKIILQIAVKAVNDSAKSDRIVLTLLVFGSYLRITKINPPSLTIAKRAKAI